MTSGVSGAPAVLGLIERNGALQKATLINTATGDQVPVQFNPEEYTVSRSNHFAQAAVPGLSGPLVQFVNGEQTTLEMELFLDTYEAGGDVRALSRAVTALMDIDPELHAPPVLLFAWGSLTFQCVLARVSQRFTMFLPSGIPVRARLQVSLQGYIDPGQEPRETKRETADYTKVYIVKQGETLSAIAAQVYQNPLLWRPIALHNRLDDPRALAAGQRLLIPRLPFRDPETGEVMR
jgi:nucleoid-associated protein YgaU